VNEEAFSLILADDLILSEKPCLDQMIKAYEQQDGNMVGVMEVPFDQTSRYGILDADKYDGHKIRAKNVVEKPSIDKSPSNSAVIGRFVLNHKIFDHLENQTPGSGGEIQLTDSIQSMLPETPLCGYRFEGQRFDCGTKEGWLEANLAFAYSSPELREGLLKTFQKYPFFNQESPKICA
jgi:UTP--glucose-1-phosphate uridylyltransferase